MRQLSWCDGTYVYCTLSFTPSFLQRALAELHQLGQGAYFRRAMRMSFFKGDFSWRSKQWSTMNFGKIRHQNKPLSCRQSNMQSRCPPSWPISQPAAWTYQRGAPDFGRTWHLDLTGESSKKAARSGLETPSQRTAWLSTNHISKAWFWWFCHLMHVTLDYTMLFVADNKLTIVLPRGWGPLLHSDLPRPKACDNSHAESCYTRRDSMPSNYLMRGICVDSAESWRDL